MLLGKKNHLSQTFNVSYLALLTISRSEVCFLFNVLLLTYRYTVENEVLDRGNIIQECAKFL